MLTINRFRGLNNVVPSTRLKSGELTVAQNVDIDATGAVRRRQGYSEVVDECHKNLHQAAGFLLATRSGDLIARWPDGTVHAVQAALGSERVAYANLPDGRTAFSNGLIAGITDGTTATPWGVPVPEHVGSLTQVGGQLYPGAYQWRLTYRRRSDGLEGGPAYSNPVQIDDGGFVLTGLPLRDGYDLNVYLTGAGGGQAYFAGLATSSAFAFSGANHELVLPCRTDFLDPAPAGTALAFWRGRALVAKDAVLWASRPGQWELFDMRRDFKQLDAPITVVVPVDDGIYVGTERELAFLAGNEWDKLAYRQVQPGRVVRGSGVPVPGERLRMGDRPGQGSAMICIADRRIVAGFNGGEIVRLTEGTYETPVTEVAATFREVRGVPQYVAVPQ